MRLLLDQNLPVPASGLLRQLGHDAIHTSEIGLKFAPDTEILDLAVAQNRIIVTRDIDFHTIIATEGRDRPSTILIRDRLMDAQALCNRTQSLLVLLESKLLAGCLITSKDKAIRIRELPISIRKRT